MKTKINQLIKFGILFFGISLLLTNCEKQDEVANEIEPSSQSKYYLTRLKANDFQENIELIDKISSIKQDIKQNKANSQARYNDVQFNFNLDEATYIENLNTNYHSYTFSIYNEQDNFDINNIVLSSNNGDPYEAYLVTYSLTEDERNQIDQGFELNLEEKTTIQEFDINQINTYSRSGGCWVFVTYEVDCSCHSVHATGGCTHPETVTESYYFDNCGSGGGSSSGNDGNPNGNPNIGGGGTSGGNTTTPDPKVATSLTNNDGSSLSDVTLTNLLSLNTEQSNWLRNNITISDQLADFLYDNNYSDEVENFSVELIDILRNETNVDENALNFVLEAFNQDKIYNNFDYNFINSVNQFMDIDATASNPGIIQLQIYFSTQCAVLRYNHPDWSDAKIYWEASKEIVHITLDIFGMVPVVGELADLTNGVLYAIEGDGVNATLSVASAVPFIGWASTGTKYGIKITNAVSTISTKIKLVWKIGSDGIIQFGRRSQLRKVLQLTDGTKQAHHIIPWAKSHLNLVQKAAKSDDAFHLNEALNGIPLNNSLHLTGHSLYSSKVDDILTELDNLNPNMSVEDAYTHVTALASHIRNLITNNPTLNSGQISNLINYP